ncbi:MAG: alpha/beta fold hydrolase [Chloroflexota bacterium]|nr:alpha/beta fold hydrolase [Chloroflexota bacterium]
MLLFNVGLNHHVGPHRMNVDLARHLAQRGFVSLRFDLSGLGDSEPRKDGRSDDERGILDVQEAMDYLLQHKSIQNVVVVGLCSGVDPAHAVAVSDARVKGAIFIDGYAYTTRGYFARLAVDRASRVLGRSNYLRWIRRVVVPKLTKRAPSINDTYPIFDRSFPPLDQFKADLYTMLGRGVHVFFLYTRQAYVFNHRGQFADMIGESTLPRGVDVEHQLGADHVFTSVSERARAVASITDWIAARFGAPTRELEAAS